MTSSFPLDRASFESLMLEIDAQLQARDIGIPQRPTHALMEIGTRFGISLPIAGRRDVAGPASENWTVTDRIYTWFDARYGSALKVDPCLGRFFTSIKGDLWVVKLPRVFGKAVFYTAAALESDQHAGRYNIADLINNFTVDLRRSLTPAQEAEITTQFVVAFEGLQWLEQNKPDSLFKLSLANIEASVEAATRRRCDFGLSKWESLQAIEKTMKAAIQRAGGKYSTTHNLSTLQREAAGVGLAFDIEAQLSAIQCTPGIRYGDEACDKIDALQAHHAMLQAVWIIKAVMEKRASAL